MPSNQKLNRDERLKKIIDLLKFSLLLEDQEIMQSTIESVIELLEEELIN